MTEHASGVAGERNPIARVLAIAGSDSGGGAGIQADIKTVTMLGGHAMTAITAVTVQNTLGVSNVYPVPAGIVREQILTVVGDLGVDAIKIGMLGDRQLIETVAGTLEGMQAPIVLDPVMVAKGGAHLLAEEAVSTLRERLLPLATLVTPNLPELEALLGMPVRGEEDMRAAGEALLRHGPAAVLAKGGHLSGPEVVDWLVCGDGEAWSYRSPRIETVHTHGTGCTLSAAIATGLASGLALDPAVRQARHFVQLALRAAPGLGRGHGPMGHARVRLPVTI